MLKLIKRIIKDYNYHICGIKISCSGKWKKTRSGRTQKFVLQFGKIKNSTLSNVIFFNQTNQKTRYGMCNLKIWILIQS
jgi:ribosomal protein S3